MGVLQSRNKGNINEQNQMHLEKLPHWDCNMWKCTIWLHSSKELCSALKKHYNTLQEHYKCRDKIDEEINLADSKRLKAIENLQNRFDKKDYEEFVESVKLKEKETKEKVSALDDIIKSLECKVNVMEIKIKEEENKNENLTNHVTTLENKKCNLEAQISEAKAELTSFGQLQAVTMEKFQYLEESNAELHSKMKSLEDDLEIKSEMMCIRDEKISNLESTVSTYEVQLDTLKNENINMKEDFEKEKNSVKICLECEQLTNKLNEMNISQQKTKEELHEQKTENKEIMKMLNEMEVC
ncbi:uncharacterized protein CEXT_806131 [Caerostris extrusa]|uniref:Uncharacterized protein n=1 Tax=Caerostris extrusa TaxID=172846 RepID=A0AAV4M3P6_CAEEX|nr:uncharacterized protein CEXT_806131 [Caerostris extrusa]